MNHQMIDDSSGPPSVPAEARRLSVDRIPGVIFHAVVPDVGLPHLTYVSPQAEELFGQRIDPRARDWGLAARIHEADRVAFWEAMHAAMRARSMLRHEARCRTPAGEIKWIQCVATPTATDEGLAYEGYLLDVTEAKRAEAEIHRLSVVVEQMGDALMITDRRGVIQYVNPAFEQHLGYTKEEIVGETPRVLKSGVHDAAFYRALWETVLAGRVYRGTMINRHKDGRLVHEEKTISPVRDEAGRIVLFIATGTDVTARCAAEAEVRRSEESLRTMNEELEHRVAERTLELARANERLARLATEDPLTALANRRRFNETLALEVRRALRRHDPISLIMCDVDHFKAYNDHLGHLEGDRCLELVAKSLIDTFRRAEDLPARYGGEEFAVILPGLAAGSAAVLAERLRERLQALAIPHPRSETSPYVTLSIGIASACVTETRDARWFVAQADMAMYASKGAGRDRVTVSKL